MREIISCSRRTDIPAFYYGWLMECLKNKYVMVPNPYNGINYRVDLSPENVHSICLWSKNFENVIKNPGFLSEYNLYFQFTITGHSRPLEPYVIATENAVKQVEKLCTLYSPQQINWRFDPVFLSRTIDDYKTASHQTILNFTRLCRDMSSFGLDKCTISLFSPYKHAIQRLKNAGINYIEPVDSLYKLILKEMVQIADKYKISIFSCATPLLENINGIKRGHCIDGVYLEKVFGIKASHAKDAGQRPGCGCTRSRDIGDYKNQPCKHGCLYCYAR